MTGELFTPIARFLDSKVRCPVCWSTMVVFGIGALGITGIQCDTCCFISNEKRWNECHGNEALLSIVRHYRRVLDRVPQQTTLKARSQFVGPGDQVIAVQYLLRGWSEDSWD